VESDALRRREVWLDFVVDANGNGRAVATREWTPTNRPDRSVVIHAVGTDHETGVAGARLACIDLDA
jgi:Cu/Zn superoxide dismutase